MAEVHATVNAGPSQVTHHNPDNGNGSNAQREGTTSDPRVKIIGSGQNISAFKNPA